MSRFDLAGAERRILDQYRRSPRLIALVKALVDTPAEELRAALESLRGRLDIDAMAGVQLDLIGSIVGRPRPDAFDPLLVQVTRVFTFRGEDEADDPEKGFDSLTSLGFRRFEGGAFGGITEAPPMNDADYRRLLKATIYLNTSGAAVPELEFYGAFVLGSALRVVNGFTQIAFELDEAPSPQALEVIRQTLLPAAGIGLTHITATDGAGGFGFDGAPNTGFASVYPSGTLTPETAWSDQTEWGDPAAFDYDEENGSGFAFVAFAA